MPCAADAAAACSRRVDLPMPGSPPTSTAETGDEAARALGPPQHAIEFTDAAGEARG